MIKSLRIKLIIFLLVILIIIIIKNKKETYENIQNIDYIFDNNFDIKYINLESSKERNNRMIKQLKNKNFKFSRFDAYDGRKIDQNFNNSLINDFSAIDFNGSIYNLKKGSLGNFISQLTCWYDFYKLSEKPYLIVMEDDILLGEKLNKKLIYETINSINENWDMIKFFHFGQLRGENNNNILMKVKSYDSSKDNTGMQFYCLNKKNIKKLIDLLLPIKNLTYDMKVKEIMNKSNIYITKEKYLSTEKNNSDRKKIDNN